MNIGYLLELDGLEQGIGGSWGVWKVQGSLPNGPQGDLEPPALENLARRPSKLSYRLGP